MNLNAVNITDLQKAHRIIADIIKTAESLDSEIYHYNKNYKKTREKEESMIRILTEVNRLVLDFEENDLAPRHASQLRFWGFTYDQVEDRYVGPHGDTRGLAKKVSTYLERASCAFELGACTEKLLAKTDSRRINLPYCKA